MTQICSLAVLEVRRLEWASLGYNEGVSGATFLLEALEKSPGPCLSRLLDSSVFLGS